MSFDKAQEVLVRFNAARFAPATAVRRLLESLPPELIFGADDEQWAQISGLSVEACRRLRAEAMAFNIDEEFAACARLGIRLVGFNDPQYPALLQSIPDPPSLLYVMGSWDARPNALAFVGSRRPTAYGRRMARRLAQEAACAGFVVVSGMARGIDTEAHDAALKAGGKTWAVLGSGLGRLYPPENDPLARQIAESGGCVMSEFPIMAPPLPENFPRRNRIVSGLCWGVVVVEGRAQSGSLITARLGLSQGREVFAVPGPADSDLSEAPFLLISQGAKAVRRLADIVEDLPPGCLQAPLCEPASSQVPFAPEHKKILESLGSEERSLEELSGETGIDLPRLSGIMVEMEFQDLVEPVPGQRYAKKGF